MSESFKTVPRTVDGSPETKLGAILEDCPRCNKHEDLVCIETTAPITAAIKCRNCGLCGGTEGRMLEAINNWNALCAVLSSAPNIKTLSYKVER